MSHFNLASILTCLYAKSDFMKLSPAWEAASRSATQEFSNVLSNLEPDEFSAYNTPYLTL
jgi:hypothetical protein